MAVSRTKLFSTATQQRVTAATCQHCTIIEDVCCKSLIWIFFLLCCLLAAAHCLSYSIPNIVLWTLLHDAVVSSLLAWLLSPLLSILPHANCAKWEKQTATTYVCSHTRHRVSRDRTAHRTTVYFVLYAFFFLHYRVCVCRLGMLFMVAHRTTLTIWESVCRVCNLI